MLLGGGVLVRIASAAIEALAGKSLRQLLMKWGIIKNETVECLKNIVDTAKEASQYIDDEGLRDVVEEVAKKWGWDVDTFKHFIKTAAGKSITEDEVKKMIEEALEKIKEELNKVKDEVKGLLVGVKVFFIDDIESGLFYGNFIVEGGVPRIKTLLGTAKNELVTDLIDAGRFREVAEGVFSRLVKDGRVVLIGPRGIGKSTLATYVAWRSLLGGLGNVALNEQLRDAVIRVDSLNPGDAVKLNNLIKVTGRRFVIIYDPSPIEAYYKPETMQMAKHDIKGIRETLKELMEVRNAWVVIILPRELYDEVSKDVALRSILDEIRSYIFDVDLRDEEFLREVTRKYSGCDDVSDDLVKGVMGFDSYTLVAKYAGIWLRESKCQVKDVDEALRESAGEPKLFFANYMWSTVLGGNEDLAKRVSIPLILHAVFGPIPEGITYITKAVNEGGVWRLIDRDSLAKSKLEDLREDDLEPIAKWLSTWHEDLIEETLKDLVGLHGEEVRNNYRNHGFENFIKALDWGYYEKALEEVRGLGRETKPEEVETNLLIFVSERLKHALKPYTNCWKRAALIIGYALSGRGLVPRPEDLPKDLLEDAKYLSDALGGCGIDDYLLVGNEIPLLIMGLVHARVLSEAFVDEYDGAVGEVDRVLEIVGNRGRIYGAEGLYGLGLASIIASVAGLGRIIKPSDADAALHIASIAIKDVLSSNLIISILHVLRPLRDYAPHRYLGLLSSASGIESLDSDTVRRILDELNEILDDYGDVVRGYAWPLANAIIAYARLLKGHREYFDDEEVEDVVGGVADLLNELGRFKTSLGVIAWAHALAPALEHEDVRGLMEEKLGIDVVGKASEVLKELNDMRKRVQELMRDEEFMSYIESKFVKADEEAVKIVILEAASLLKHALAIYRLDNNELDEAEELFNEAAEERREIGDYENDLVARGLALRVEAIKGSLVGDELVNGFRQLYEEAFNEEHFIPTARYLSIVSNMLGGYLVSLALTGNYEKINELLEKYRWVLNANKQASVLTRLVLNALLGSKDRKDQLGSELKDKLSVNPEELIDAFGYDVLRKYLPALRVAPGIAKPEDVGEMCMLINDSIKGKRVVCGDYAIEWLRWGLVDDFRESLIEEFGRLKELGVNADKLLNMFDKFMELVVRLDGESLVQLNAPTISIARLALMLYALVNGDEELAKAHALYGAVKAIGSKLLTKLFLEAYESCCDLGSEGFRRTIAKLFLLHV
jgi:tetratricopeptide (TPR) repeat protein